MTMKWFNVTVVTVLQSSIPFIHCLILDECVSLQRANIEAIYRIAGISTAKGILSTAAAASTVELKEPQHANMLEQTFIYRVNCIFVKLKIRKVY